MYPDNEEDLGKTLSGASYVEDVDEVLASMQIWMPS
jgi:hypothetical protein